MKVMLKDAKIEYRQNISLKAGTAEKLTGKLDPPVKYTWDTMDVACFKEVDRGEFEEESGKLVTLDEITVEWTILADYNPTVLPKEGTKIYLCKTTAGTKTTYTFEATKPGGGDCEEFNWDDVKRHVADHVKPITEIFKKLLEGQSAQKRFCGGEMANINKWKSDTEAALTRKIAKDLIHQAVEGASGESDEQAIRKRQFEALRGGAGHGG